MQVAELIKELEALNPDLEINAILCKDCSEPEAIIETGDSGEQAIYDIDYTETIEAEGCFLRIGGGCICN